MLHRSPCVVLDSVRLGPKGCVAWEESEELEGQAEGAEDQVSHAKDKRHRAGPLGLDHVLLEHKDAGTERTDACKSTPKDVHNKDDHKNIIQREVLNNNNNNKTITNT